MSVTPPEINHPQKAEGVRKFVTSQYRWLIHYTVNDAAGEIVVLNVKHPAGRRDHEDT